MATMRDSWKRRLGLWAPPVTYAVAIFWCSSMSHPLPVVTIHVWDKLLHLAEYGGLALLFARAFAGEGYGWLATMVAAVLLTSTYGVTDEWHQSFVPLRTSDVFDWFADALGALAGTIIYLLGAAANLRRTPR